jgi:hypothetical protein
MQLLRMLLIAFAVVIMGTIANAATGGVHGKRTPSPSAAVSDSSDGNETDAREAESTTSDQTGTAPDISACDGLTGLDNAICRHDALLKVKPDKPGLTNSPAHLQANLAAQAARRRSHRRKTGASTPDLRQVCTLAHRVLGELGPRVRSNGRSRSQGDAGRVHDDGH